MSDADREARLAARLRENLKKRKALAKTRTTDERAEAASANDAGFDGGTDAAGATPVRPSKPRD